VRADLTGTYRLQLTPGFGFDEVAAMADYLAALGISHVYLSPILQAAPGSTHGYDVIDHGRLSGELGGEPAWQRLQARLSELGLRMVVDIVPNHMAAPVPEWLNAPLWDVLKHGQRAAHAHWFDIDWESHGGKVLLPILGAPLAELLDNFVVAPDAGPDGQPVLRYFDHVLPLAPGTEQIPLPELLGAQHYRVAFWRDGERVLIYRRFFDITTLIGLRVEDPAVFEATHRLTLRLAGDGQIDGLRIDHPDGLADPRGYLRRLSESLPDCWIVVEKILEPGEELPADWPCAGTTGYDAANAVIGLFIDPAGEGPMTQTYVDFTGEPAEFAAVAERAKRDVLEDVLAAELNRLTDLAARITDLDRDLLRETLSELLIGFDVYRAYVVPGEEPAPEGVEAVENALRHALARRPDREAELRLLARLALGRDGRDSLRDEFVVRFGQTTGPLMAKGVEDTALYRWHRFLALSEVGGDPTRFGVTRDEFDRYAEARQRSWPRTMTTLSTHDTKRSEDVRARLAVLAEIPDAWREAVVRWQHAAARHRSGPEPHGWPDQNTAYLLWQTLVGAWPLSLDRLASYIEKATREAKRETSWTDPDPAYHDAARRFLETTLADEALMRDVAAFVEQVLVPGRINALAAKLVQLTMPGVPDVYQGTELEALSLVDPDNRRAVDFDARRELLRRLDDGWLPSLDDFDAVKLLVTSRALRLRRQRPGWFDDESSRLSLDGPAAGHLIAFSRGGAVTLATRLPKGLEQRGGWGDTTVRLPRGEWADVLTGRHWGSGTLRADELLRRLPVALLARDRRQPA
jgi:(1->4)-alpha-D-glucan 1-alpha-D-glucosylmutase